MTRDKETWLLMAGGALCAAAIVYKVAERSWDNGALTGAEKAYETLGLKLEDVDRVRSRKFKFIDLPNDLREDIMDSFPDKEFRARDTVVIITK